MPTYRLSLLGRLELLRESAPIKEVKSTKSLALLSYLAVMDGPQPRASLAGLLWGGMPESNARASLSKVLSSLRHYLGDHMAITRQHVTLVRGAGFWLDVAEFTAAADGETIEELEEAVALYRGDFLDGFVVRDAPEFEHWMLAEQARLKAIMLSVLQELAGRIANEGAAGRAKAIAYTERLLQLEPWREEAHRQLMLLLAEDGRRGAALAQFESCRSALEEELAVAPGEETVTLFERIRDGQIRRREAVVPAANPDAPHYNLPAETTPFVGRETELAEVDRLLDDPTVRLVTILAPGGMGKTRLAIEAAMRQVGKFRDGVFFVALAPISDPGIMVSAIAAGVGYTLQGDDRPPRRQLLDYLRGKDMLLVLDNAEHLLAGVELFTEILEGCANLRLLVTTRERLRLSSESILALSGLSLSGQSGAGMSAAAALFIQSAQRVRSGFEPTVENSSDLMRICRLVMGMPLGLVLAAAWIEMLSVNEIADEVERSLDFLAADLRDLPERQRSVRAVFEGTRQRLSAAEDDAFRRLAVFRGGFTREAAYEVAGASLATLTSLSHKSLIRRNPDGRYEVHELLRQFALEALVGDEGHVRNAHSAYYCARLQDWYGDLTGRRQEIAMAEIKTNAENIRTAWRWATEQDHRNQVAQALDGLCLAWLWQSQLQEGVALCQMIVERPQPNTSGRNEESGRVSATYARLRVRALIWTSVFHRGLFRLDIASQNLERASAMLTRLPLAELETRREEALLLLEQAEVAELTGDHTGAELSRQSIDLLRQLDDPWHLARAFDIRGALLRSSGQFELARRAQEEGLALRRVLGDERGIAYSLHTLGAIARLEGKFDESEASLRRSIAIFQKLNDGGQEATSLGALAVTLTVSGMYTQGLQTFEAEAALRSELGLPRHIDHLVVAGYGLMLAGNYEAARQSLREAQAIHAEGTQTGITGWIYSNLGRIAMADEEYAIARDLLQQSLAIFRDQQQYPGMGSSFACLGITAILVDDRVEAQKYIWKSLQIAADTGLFLPCITSLSSRALLEAHQGNIEFAVELYALASQHKHVANSGWYQMVIGRPIAAAAEGLSPQVVEGAQARGRARDLVETITELVHCQS